MDNQSERQVRLISAMDRVPENGTLLLGFHFKTTPGWYVYWKFAGETGYRRASNGRVLGG